LTERARLAAAPGLNHGILIHGEYLYASSPTTVYRWRYHPGDRTNLGNPEVVINNVINTGGHTSRTLEFDTEDRLYVQHGSDSNIDTNLSHSLIRRFRIPSAIPAGGFNFATGELFAFGLRNEVGLKFDSTQRLWGVENGIDDLYRADLGGDIHNNNPSEEVNLFDKDTPGKFYGYPYCWTQYNLTENHGNPTGTQWAYPQFMPDTTDAWCNNNNNVVKPAYNLQAHYAPLDISFYYGRQWPTSYIGGAFVSAHGSWNRNPAVGYRVVHITFENGVPVKNDPFLYYSGQGETGSNWQRPVSIGFGKCSFGDCMFVSSDSTGVLIAVGYTGGADDDKLIN